MEVPLDNYLENHVDDNKENGEESKDSLTCTVGKVPRITLDQVETTENSWTMVVLLSEYSTSMDGIGTVETPSKLEVVQQEKELLEADDDSSHLKDPETGPVCHHHPPSYLRAKMIL